MNKPKWTPEQLEEYRKMLHWRIDALCDAAEDITTRVWGETLDDGYGIDADGKQYLKFKPGPNREMVIRWRVKDAS